MLHDIRDFIFLWKMGGLCFFHMISHILSRRIKIDKLVFASSLELNFCKRGEKNLAQTNFSDQRRRQDDICHSILNKISFICIMDTDIVSDAKRNNTLSPSILSKIEEVLSYKFFTSLWVHARWWRLYKYCKNCNQFFFESESIFQ